jgi:uncharacterized protein YecT (DUF1311 family)
MSRLTHVLIATGILLMALPVPLVVASTEAADPTSDPCVTQKDTSEIAACLWQIYVAADAELNRAYKELLESLSLENESARAKLVKAQRAWIKYRDSDCEAVYQYWSLGTARGRMATLCLISRTETRRMELYRWRDE